MARAKDSFRRGVTMLGAGDVQRALELFLESRATLASGKNTANAAICLERLGRYDEALELYEDVLTRFAADLELQDRRNLVPAMDALRRRLGELEISANAPGLLLVDGRPRGAVPRETPLLVMPGRHIVRLVRDGYETAERELVIAERSTTQLDLVLRPLARTAGLRIEAEPGSSVLIDGASRGSAPWEGTLAPGSHVYQVLHAERGSRPTSITLVGSRTTLVRARLSSLGPAVELRVVPMTGNVLLDGVPIGVGHWRGRLPLGRYMFQASALGFLSGHEAFELTSGDPKAQKYVIHLIPWHWQEPLFSGDLELTLGGSFLTGVSRRSSAEAAPSVIGASVEARAGYRVPSALSAELAVGFLALRELLWLRAPYATLGASVRRPLYAGLAFEGRIDAGLAYVSASDVLPLLRPELGASLAYGRVRFGAALGLLFAPSVGPRASGSEERAHGTLELCAPRLFVTAAL